MGQQPSINICVSCRFIFNSFRASTLTDDSFLSSRTPKAYNLRSIKGGVMMKCQEKKCAQLKYANCCAIDSVMMVALKWSSELHFFSREFDWLHLGTPLSESLFSRKIYANVSNFKIFGKRCQNHPAVQKDSNFHKKYLPTLEKARFTLLCLFALKVSQEVRTYPPNLPRPSF